MRYLVLIFLLSACATQTKWVGSGDMHKDKKKCEYEAAKHKDHSSALFSGEHDIFESCMKNKGYRKGYAEEIEMQKTGRDILENFINESRVRPSSPN